MKSWNKKSSTEDRSLINLLVFIESIKIKEHPSDIYILFLQSLHDSNGNAETIDPVVV
jgi:hypothetical protein